MGLRIKRGGDSGVVVPYTRAAAMHAREMNTNYKKTSIQMKMHQRGPSFLFLFFFLFSYLFIYLDLVLTKS